MRKYLAPTFTFSFMLILVGTVLWAIAQESPGAALIIVCGGVGLAWLNVPGRTYRNPLIRWAMLGVSVLAGVAVLLAMISIAA